MACQSEEDLCCPVCHDIFKDPVVLSCSHNFCKACLDSWWTGSLMRKCPLCLRSSSTGNPPRNLELKSLCEAFLLQRDQTASAEAEPPCSLHSEKLKLFCLDHQQSVCVVCLHSETHTDHKFRPIVEAAQNHREELQKSLKPVKEKLKRFYEVKSNFDQTAEHIQVQAQKTERQIKEEFKKLHQFLQEEERARIAALREEEEQKSQMMKEKMEALSREIADLSDRIRVAEKGLRAKDTIFLQNYKATVERVQRPLLEDPQLPSGALIDEAKHLGNLSFTVWSKVKKMVSYTPVVLDPNTAYEKLVMSEDLSTVRWGERQELPENPERFRCCSSVLGSEGFHSGMHSWDVQVGDNTHWEVGVIAESVHRNKVVREGLWVIEFYFSEYTAYTLPEGSIDLPMKKKVQKIRVRLDWKRGTLSFSDPDSNTRIHTFTPTFTDRLFPYISTWNALPLRILPAEVAVEQHS